MIVSFSNLNKAAITENLFAKRFLKDHATIENFVPLIIQYVPICRLQYNLFHLYVATALPTTLVTFSQSTYSANENIGQAQPMLLLTSQYAIIN